MAPGRGLRSLRRDFSRSTNGPTVVTRPISEREIARLGADLERHGFAALDDFASDEELGPIRVLARTAVRQNRGEVAILEGPDRVAGTMLDELSRSAEFREVCRRLSASGGAPGAEGCRQYVRCLQGRAGQRSPQVEHFHFDAYIVSALLPIEIPAEGGTFVIIPNVRPLRRSYLLNVVEHRLVASRLCRPLWRLLVRRGWWNAKVIRLQPRTMYFFWGLRSIHTNTRCDPNALRATALFFYGRPDYAARSRRVLAKLRGRRRDARS